MPGWPLKQSVSGRVQATGDLPRLDTNASLRIGDEIVTGLRVGFSVTLLGVLIGVAGLLLLRSVLESQIYGISAGDPFLATAAAVVLVAIALTACLVPAYRATRVDPVVVLSEE